MDNITTQQIQTLMPRSPNSIQNLQKTRNLIQLDGGFGQGGRKIGSECERLEVVLVLKRQRGGEGFIGDFWTAFNGRLEKERSKGVRLGKLTLPLLVN